ncbi:hypothetical protein AsAng_0030130 [Aureispira anguillae]|uniref:Uncharacterized protein n=1 Tax=Aureispira anguillae TaxID=2864201 RepID=A0A916DS55_9BACT|nr:hypothetical protein AsAng_0030130 [Aureispira anguillae]
MVYELILRYKETIEWVKLLRSSCWKQQNLPIFCIIGSS